MNLRFVEAFYWAASLKSVTRASERLFLTQSAVSSRIAALEDELGVLLLDRRDKQFRLTVAGLRFLTHAQRLLELQREVKTEMGSGAPQPMTLRLGAIESVLHSWLIPMVERLRESQPRLELELTVETTPVLIDQIGRGSLDLVFAAAPAALGGLRSRALPPMERFPPRPHGSSARDCPIRTGCDRRACRRATPIAWPFPWRSAHFSRRAGVPRRPMRCRC